MILQTKGHAIRCGKSKIILNANIYTRQFSKLECATFSIANIIRKSLMQHLKKYKLYMKQLH